MKSESNLYLIQNYLLFNDYNEPIWSDFTGTGLGQDDYVNGESKTIEDLAMNYAWKIGTSYDKNCVQMKSDVDYALEPKIAPYKQDTFV